MARNTGAGLSVRRAAGSTGSGLIPRGSGGQSEDPESESAGEKRSLSLIHPESQSGLTWRCH